jgi:hypothetical protein
VTAFVRLDEADAALAAQWATAVSSSGIAARENYTGISAPNRYLVGYIGELAFAAWLSSMRILHRHRVALHGASEAPEFVVWRSGKACTVDVKTGRGERVSRLMMPAAQKHDATLYVAAHVLTEATSVVELAGWISADDLERRPIGDFGYGPTRWCPFSELRSMRELLNELDYCRVVKERA